MITQGPAKRRVLKLSATADSMKQEAWEAAYDIYSAALEGLGFSVLEVHSDKPEGRAELPEETMVAMYYEICAPVAGAAKELEALLAWLEELNEYHRLSGAGAMTELWPRMLPAPPVTLDRVKAAVMREQGSDEVQVNCHQRLAVNLATAYALRQDASA